MNEKTKDVWFGLLVGAIALAVYLLTAPSALLPAGDAGEILTVCYTLGVAHAPGYPLFTILGHVACLLFPGSPAHRMAVFTALLGCLTVIMVYFCVWLITRRRAASAVAAWTFAFSYHAWLYSLVPDVMIMSAFFVALMFLLVLAYVQEGDQFKPSPMLLAFAGGLAISHQYSLLILAPAFAYLIFGSHPKRMIPRSWPRLIAMIGCFTAGLLPILYLPWRAPQWPYMNAGSITSFGRLLDHLTRRTYGLTSLTPNYTQWTIHSLLSPLGFYASALLDSISMGGIILAALGLVRLYRRERNLFWAWLLAFVLCGPFFIALTRLPAEPLENKVILERFFLNSLVILALALGHGVAWVLDELPPFLHRTFGFGTSGKAMTWLAIFCIPLWLAIQNYSRLDFHDFDWGDNLSRNLIGSFEPHAVVIANGDQALFTLYYAQQVLGLRPDIKIVAIGMDEASRESVHHNYPDLLMPESGSAEEVIHDIIANNFKQFPIYEVGFSGDRFKGYGLLGNPYTLQPRGLAMKVVARFDPASDDSALWNSFEIPKVAERPVGSNYFVRQILFYYGMDRYNAALLYNQNGRVDLVREYVREACRLDPFFLQLPLAALL